VQSFRKRKNKETTLKGYWLILGTSVTDQSAQDEYGRLWAPIAQKYQARLNPTNAPLQKESRDTSRVIGVEFPSLEAARNCYDDPAYQEALTFALKASRRDLLIFEGEIA